MDNLLNLTDVQVKQIFEKGYTHVMCPCGCGDVKKIFKDELLFKEEEIEDIEKLMSEENKK